MYTVSCDEVINGSFAAEVETNAIPDDLRSISLRILSTRESTFATIRLRHRKTKNNGSAKASLVMIFKLAQSAAKGWRKLRGHQHIPELIKGVRFIDGVIEQSVDELKSSTTKSPTTHTEIVA